VAVLSPRLARRALGAGLLLLASLPCYRLLAVPGTGSAGAATVAMADSYVAASWSGTLLLLLLGLLAARFFPWPVAQAWGARLETLLLRPPLFPFAIACGVTAAGFTFFINQVVLHGEPQLVDALSQLVQARYLAADRLAGPVSPFAAFWHLQQTVVTPAGWVSQYPPLHVLLLALGFRLGAVPLVGPVLFGGTVYLTALLADRLFARAPLVARVGVLLLTLSPFAAVHAAAYMNHVSAALLSVLALYAGARVRERNHGRWTLALGLSLGLLFATRPLTAVVMAALLAGWLAAGMTWRGRVRLLAGAAAAALPVLVLLGWYNQHFFGNPFRFGYIAALGSDGGLGFGTDPWGNRYGLRAAVGYTAAELGALNLFLLESVLPVVSLAGLALLLMPRLEPGTRLVAGWAMLPLLAHLAYWHHGLFMGPRMLNEYAPAWCLLVAAAAIGLLRLTPAYLPRAPRWSPKVLAGTVLVASWACAVFWATPARLRDYYRAQSAAPQLARHLPARSLVFVHGSWNTRLAMQLAGSGMRLDSLETLMRQNSTCTVQRWLDAGRQGVAVTFDRTAPAGGELLATDLAPGSRVRVQPAEWWPASCVRQAAADRTGVTEVAALLWRAGLPGVDSEQAMLVRDLGPEANRRLITALHRPAYVLRGPAGEMALVPYAAVIDRIWGAQTEPASRNAGLAERPGT